ncbi:MAG TPA: hypothetical protein DD670_07635 [Planctomycetaceae bacterium]|nr:hypothetical protein [Planctomycetaceae bacterium]
MNENESDNIVSVSEQLRASILASSYSTRRLAREADTHFKTILRFRRGEWGMRLETFDRLCKVLNLRLVADNTNERSPNDETGTC